MACLLSRDTVVQSDAVNIFTVLLCLALAAQTEHGLVQSCAVRRVQRGDRAREQAAVAVLIVEDSQTPSHTQHSVDLTEKVSGQ